MGKLVGPGQFQVVNGTDLGTVLLGGIEFVESGGNAIDTVIEAGGIQFVTSGGKASFDTVDLGGVQNVGAYGQATSTTVNHGGLQSVAVNGRTDFATIDGGTQYLRGLSYFTDLINGGIEDVGEHGYARYTTIEANSLQDVLANGYSEYAHVKAGGKEIVEHTGWADYTNVGFNGVQDVFGSTNQGAIHGVQKIENGGTDNFSEVYSGGMQEVLGGGTATGNFIDQGGYQYVAGEADYAWLHGSQYVAKNGYAVHTDVASGAQQIVDGFAISSAIEGGGLMEVDAGGAATKTGIDTGGIERVLNGGHELDTTFWGAGTLDLDDAASVGVIESWQAGAKIDIRDLAFGANSFLNYDAQAGILTVSNGQHSEYLHFMNPTGVFNATSDGHGGTLISNPVGQA